MEIKLTRWFIYKWGKPIRQKPHWMILRSSLPRIHYYQNKWLQVKGISVPSTNLQLNPYPNTQLDLQCSDNLYFQCMAPSTWLTNWCIDPCTWLAHQLEEDVSCKVFQFIQRWRSRSSLITKPLAQRHSSFYKEYDELGQILSPVTIWMHNQFALSCITFDDP